MNATLAPGKRDAGWLGIGAIALTYGVLFALNLGLPLASTNYTTRIWDASQAALTAAAALVALRYRWRVTLRAVMLGLALGLASALSHNASDPSPWWNLWQGVGVWLCFVGGTALAQAPATPRVAAFEGPLGRTVQSIAFGIGAALPLALLNTLYFAATLGGRPLREPLWSAFRAFSPGIHEEIIFRYFVFGLCFSLLREVRAKRLAVIATVALAVIPHSLNHLPDLLRVNPLMAVGLLIATSLLFGLPMALLQMKRNLETAITFHGFIDFIRFLFGY